MPVNSVAVQKIADRDLREPTVCPMIKIAADNTTWDPTSCRGAWRRITPEEVVHAYILAIARDVRNPASAEDGGFQKGRRKLLGGAETRTSFGESSTQVDAPSNLRRARVDLTHHRFSTVLCSGSGPVATPFKSPDRKNSSLGGSIS